MDVQVSDATKPMKFPLQGAFPVVSSERGLYGIIRELAVSNIWVLDLEGTSLLKYIRIMLSSTDYIENIIICVAKLN